MRPRMRPARAPLGPRYGPAPALTSPTNNAQICVLSAQATIAYPVLEVQSMQAFLLAYTTMRRAMLKNGNDKLQNNLFSQLNAKLLPAFNPLLFALRVVYSSSSLLNASFNATASDRGGGVL